MAAAAAAAATVLAALIGRYIRGKIAIFWTNIVTSKYELLRIVQTRTWAHWKESILNCALDYKMSLTLKVIKGHGRSKRPY